MPRNPKVETRKKNMKKRSTERQRKSSLVQTKTGLPPHVLRAHQAAYNFLNQNISKYEILLGLLDQATQTQLSLQTPMSALALYFEEINQALEEMAEEGELMLKEHGDSMSLPSGIFGQAVCSAKPMNNFDPSPDLLHQLLQDSSEKIRQVKTSVKTLSDTTLEEGIDYFSSFSKLYTEKLQAKQAAEFRLAQVLARVETVAFRKSNPEDSALHSEDSGIGGENESLTGSERNHGHRGSAGSGSCGSEVNIRGAQEDAPSRASECSRRRVLLQEMNGFWSKSNPRAEAEAVTCWGLDVSVTGATPHSSAGGGDFLHLNREAAQQPGSFTASAAVAPLRPACSAAVKDRRCLAVALLTSLCFMA
ncbi:hypothetical protein CCH79_00000002 [Gambusia affinis]|uniref:Uncharacterized protein n=1 Tax=Gambusia affinis TaxID=33528 RepID=A0A315VWQ6_GAMAF|nr:hypothetical protein CCH79_00000002 [Gambusia affinis]